MRILVVDDDAVSLRLLVALVERLGHQAVTAADGAAAWGIFLAGGCRVVISDWTMPGMEGIDLLRRVRDQDAVAYTYFIMLTARSDRADHTAGMAAGADDFLVKPVRRDELDMRLRVAERIVGLQEELARRHRELSAANERMQGDIAAAVKVQEALLPTVLPVVPGLGCAWRFHPCEQLGGDTLNLFRLDEQHLGFFILDVSGHGVPSALLAVQVSRFLSPLIMPGALLKTAQPAAPGYRLTPPLEVLRQLNGLFPMQRGNLQYFTIVLGHYHVPATASRWSRPGTPDRCWCAGAGGSRSRWWRATRWASTRPGRGVRRAGAAPGARRPPLPVQRWRGRDRRPAGRAAGRGARRGGPGGGGRSPRGQPGRARRAAAGLAAAAPGKRRCHHPGDGTRSLAGAHRGSR